MSKKIPLVSILIPCYNGSKYIDRCLNSCLNQTYQNIEIIIVDDGSKDESLKILKNYTTLDSRIKVYSQKNKGLGSTRNVLISKCNGYYFSFLDIDDTLPKDAINNLVNNSLNATMDIVVGRAKIIRNNNFIFPFIPSWRYCKNMTNGHYVKSNICTPWGHIIKRDFFNSLNIKFIDGMVFEDIGVFTYVFLKTPNFRFIKNVVYNYYRHKLKDAKQKPLSSFKNHCLKKNNDIYFQTKQILNYLSKEKLFITKEYKRYINGLLFQVIPISIFLTANLTNSYSLQYILRYSLIKLIIDHGFKPKFTKTFWKTLTYFYIYINCKKIMNDIHRDKFTHRKTTGVYLNDIKQSKSILHKKMINLSKSNMNLTIGSILNRNIYLITLTQLLKQQFKWKHKPWIGIKTNNQNYKEIIKNCDIYFSNNLKNFFVIDEKFESKNIEKLYLYGIGFIIDVNNLNEKVIKLIDKIDNLEMKRMIILCINKKQCDYNLIRNKVDRIYYK